MSKKNSVQASQNLLERDMTVEQRAIEDVKPYERNPRLNNQAVDAVARSIQEYGWQQPLVIDKDGVVIAGHTRLKAAERLGLKTVPVVVADKLTPDQVRAYRIADNRIAEIADWDTAKLGIELRELESASYDLSLLGFDETELEQLMAIVPEAGQTDPDDIPDTPVHPKSKEGRLYQLGRHVLLCGDSTKEQDVQRLMGGKKASLWITDPPYNVDYSNKNDYLLRVQKGNRIKDPIKNDKMSDEQFNAFLEASFRGAKSVLEPGGAFYVWFADKVGDSFYKAAQRAGLSVKQGLIWIKNQIVLSLADYQVIHELCLYGWNEGRHSYYNDRKQRTVIDIPGQPFQRGENGRFTLRIGAKVYSIAEDAVCEEEITSVIEEQKPRANSLHPTMKPVELFERLIKNSSRKKQIVLDTFAGSGTTVIACERQGRIARVIELETKYADVIRKRWAEYTHGEGCDWIALTPEIKEQSKSRKD